ncbi:MAG: GAF domain-containing protein [bacterium]|nr:GAF domain-containing protein [bacterium]
MSPDATRRFRRTTSALGVVWAVSAFVLAIWGQLATPRIVDPPLHTSTIGRTAIVNDVSDEARALGVREGDRVLEVDGLVVQEWYRERGWERIVAGKPVTYRIETGTGILDLSLQPRARRSAYQSFTIPIFAALAVAGSAYLLLGLFVWSSRADHAESWAFLLFSCAMATALFGGVNTYDAPFGYERMVITMPLIGASMFHLFTIYPLEPQWVSRRHRLRLIPYLLALAIAVAVIFERPLGIPPGLLAGLGYGLGAGGCAIAFLVLVHERYKRRGSGQTAAADLVLTAALVSFVPVMLALLAQTMVSLPFPMSLAMVWFVVFPGAMAYGIVRRGLFDMRGLARSSAAYGAATLAITGVFAGLITGADAAFRQFNVTANSPLFSVTFLFFAILAFNPLRDRLQTLVDRLFDRDRAAYRNAVREISEAMVSMLSLEEVSDRLLLAVTDTMGVERAMVLLLGDDERSLVPVAWRGDFDEEATVLELPIDHPVGKHLWMRRQELARTDFDDLADPETREECWDVFDLLHVKLLVPILFGVDLLGLIAVGEKLSGERLGPDDRQLLRTLANQSAIAIENAQAFDEIAKLNETLEARVEARTNELQEAQAQLMQSEKLRSLGQLVAGVAHELNNPIGFVHANLQLLDDFVKKLVLAQEAGADFQKPREAIRKLLSRSREGTERVKKIVLDLRTFSRMDQAEIADANLNEEIERTLALMEPRFTDGITLEREFGKLPKVRCYPAQLNQVFMNLVMNACDALDGEGTVRIVTRSIPDGVILEFSDDGAGIPDDVLGRIFEPFFTTKPVGQGTGLGLSISHGIVERHGGTLDVETDPDGTLFRIHLPLVAKASEEEPPATG